jgi:stearoyl-CoA desaturase (delta-9 desaturase)
MVTKEWVAVHRKHHRYVDEPLDPHSPGIYGIWRVLFAGVLLYSDATKDQQMVKSYGAGTPNDWIEKNIYSKFPLHGVILLLVLNTWLFHGWGIVIWLIQMAWIPFWAAGVINGIGHFWGYRNYNTSDTSKNIVPFGILIGGEELHNNHHQDPASAKLSNKWWELDIGWIYLKAFSFLGLAKIK